jgi:hypothetical protein
MVMSESELISLLDGNLPFDEVVIFLIATYLKANEAWGEKNLGENNTECSLASRRRCAYDFEENSGKSKSPIGLDFCTTESSPVLDALKVYLAKILSQLAMTAKSQRCMVCTWLSEIYMHQLTFSALLTSSSSSSLIFSSSNSNESGLQESFKSFLRENK